MTILYLSYWEADSPLTISTVHPHLRILQSFSNINRIVFVTLERRRDKTFVPFELPKVIHIPLYSLGRSINLLNKISDFKIFPKLLLAIVRKYQVEKIIARSSLAGALAYILHKRTKIPFYVESFEPHADYMKESMIWRTIDPRYIFQKRWESRQLQEASAIITVSNAYRKALLAQGLPAEKLFTIPCCVPLDLFRFSEESQKKTRSLLNIGTDNIVGIYTGKFGGLYYDEEAFIIFKRAFLHFGLKFRLLLLSPEKEEFIRSRLQAADVPQESVFIRYVRHNEIPAFLNAADFAFALYKPNRSASYLSPIKIGEYWANGLPVLCTENIGDDSLIIEQEAGGAVFNLKSDSLENAFEKLKGLIEEKDSRIHIRALAKKYRNFSIAESIYRKLYGGG